MVDIVPKPPKFSDRAYVVRDRTGSLDPTKYLGALYEWGSRFAATVNNEFSAVRAHGEPMTAEDVTPVTAFTTDMSQEELAAGLCYLVKCLQDASILPKKNGDY